MKPIPKEILERLEMETRDEITYVTAIKPVDPCECGAVLNNTRVVKVNKTEFPFPHIREYCYACRCHRHRGGEWYGAVRDLNQAMRAQSYPRKPVI